MRANEFITEDLDESLGRKAAAAAIATALSAGAYKAADNMLPKHTPVAEPENISTLHPQKTTNRDINLVAKKEIKLNALGEMTKKAAIAAGIKGVELEQFMAQVWAETLNFTHLEERPWTKSAMNDPKFFEKRYGIKYNPRKAKDLGNLEYGDGTKFKGRGMLMLTGRENYTRMAKALGDPEILRNPDVIATPEYAIKSAIIFWTKVVRPRVKDFEDTARVTKIITGGKAALDVRNKIFQQYKGKLGDDI